MDLESTLFDEEKEKGVEVPFGEDGTLIVARMYTDHFNVVFREKLRKAGRMSSRDEGTQRRILTECMAECCLKGWSGLRVGGKDVKWSVEKGLELMNKFPALRDAVMDAANDQTNFRIDDVEATLKN